MQRGAACLVLRSNLSVFKVAFYIFVFASVISSFSLPILNMKSVIMEDCGGERPSVQIVNNEESRNCFTSFSSLFISSFSSLFILFKLFDFLFISADQRRIWNCAKVYDADAARGETWVSLRKKRNKVDFPVLCTELRYFAHAIVSARNTMVYPM